MTNYKNIINRLTQFPRLFAGIWFTLAACLFPLLFFLLALVRNIPNLLQGQYEDGSFSSLLPVLYAIPVFILPNFILGFTLGSLITSPTRIKSRIRAAMIGVLIPALSYVIFSLIISWYLTSIGTNSADEDFSMMFGIFLVVGVMIGGWLCVGIGGSAGWFLYKYKRPYL